MAEEEQEEVLVIKHGALGDFVKATGRMVAIRARHPHARITLLTQKFLSGLANATGCFDALEFDERGYSPADWWRVIVRLIASRKWTMVYDLQGSSRTLHRYRPLAIFATRYALTWARARKWGFELYTTGAKLPFTPAFAKRSRLEVAFPKPDLSFCKAKGENFSLLPERYALLIPGCSATNPQKRWPPERYRELTVALGEKGVKSVVMGTRAEAAEISAITDGNPNAIDFMGKSALEDIPQLALRSVVVVGNDTGPTHMARLSGARTIMLFTSYDASRAAETAENVTNLVGERIEDISTQSVIDAVMKGLR